MVPVMEMNILIVDDDEVMLEIVASALAPLDCHVETAGSVESALAVMDKMELDLVITDKNMPSPDDSSDEGGMAIIRAAKKSSQDTEVILMTGYATIETAIEALQLGAFDYLIKPFDIDDLIGKVKRLSEFNTFINPRKIIDIYKDFHSEMISTMDSADDKKLNLLNDKIDKFLRIQKDWEFIMLGQREALANIASLVEQSSELIPSTGPVAELVEKITAETDKRI